MTTATNPGHAGGAAGDEDERSARLLRAQARAEALFDEIGARAIISPGVTDREASDAISRLAADMFGIDRHWHKRVVRSGPHTMLPYRENPPDRMMTDDDIVFADFGPIFEGWEADLGRTWVIGNDPTKLRLRDDLLEVFDAGRRHFDASPGLTGAGLYAEIIRLSTNLGWEFGNTHSGHVVGEFPHEMFPGDRAASYITPCNDEPMRRLDPSGRVTHWILEVHLVDRERGFGGFHEQLLTLR